MPSHTFPTGLLTITVPAGQSVMRVHQLGMGALWFGPAPGSPPGYRFDAPAGEYRTLYCAEHLTGAFVETVLRRAKRIIARPFVEARGWTELTCKRDLKLAKIYDEGLVRHGVTNDICAGDDYAASQSFAAALYAADAELDGIAYRARHNNGQICYALFDRVGTGEFNELRHRPFRNERTVVEAIMTEHGAVWDPLTALPSA